MKNKLILSAGMPRAGSGWFYNLMHDLVVAGGGKDAHDIRERFWLNRILTEVNCNIGSLNTLRLSLAMIPVLLGNTYTIKAHAAPKSFTKWLIANGWMKAAYIYRDPRDALLSAYEYGKRMRAKGGTNAFSHLMNIEQAIDFMREYVEISQEWLACKNVLFTRYEDLLENYEEEALRLVKFLGVRADDRSIEEILHKYQPGLGVKERKGLHFVTGKTKRYLQEMTTEQIELCQAAFGDYLRRWGYA